MARYFTDEEKAQWLKSQPRKFISSKLVLLDGKERLFFTKPNYKPGWNLVGGMVDENESPLAAALRETKEETGIFLAKQRLTFLGVRYGISKNSGDDYIHFIFCARLTSEEVSAMQMQTDEIEDTCWVNLVEADEKIDVQDHTWPLVKSILGEEICAYFDDDKTVVPFER